ncbi:MAG: hypothetical protein Kow0037_20570 [Calditrichia bacterium]
MDWQVISHPFLVHFIVALYLSGFFLDVLAEMRGSEKLRFAAWMNHIGAALGALGAVISGLIAKSHSLFVDEAVQLLERHETAAFVVFALVAGQFFWRFSAKGQIPANSRWLYWLLSLLTVIVLLLTAHWGGRLMRGEW